LLLPNSIDALRRESEEAEDILVSSLTEYELLVGAYYLWLKKRDAGEKIWLDNLLTWLTVRELDERAIKRSANGRRCPA